MNMCAMNKHRFDDELDERWMMEEDDDDDDEGGGRFTLHLEQSLLLLYTPKKTEVTNNLPIGFFWG